jgi:hypothetical protein
MGRPECQGIAETDPRIRIDAEGSEGSAQEGHAIDDPQREPFFASQPGNLGHGGFGDERMTRHCVDHALIGPPKFKDSPSNAAVHLLESCAVLV